MTKDMWGRKRTQKEMGSRICAKLKAVKARAMSIKTRLLFKLVLATSRVKTIKARLRARNLAKEYLAKGLLMLLPQINNNMERTRMIQRKARLGFKEDTDFKENTSTYHCLSLLLILTLSFFFLPAFRNYGSIRQSEIGMLILL